MYDSKQMKQDVETIRQSGWFDADWYRATYPDVDRLGMDPAEHYLRFGKLMGRAPAPAARVEAPTVDGPAKGTESGSVVDTPDAESFVAESLQAYTGLKTLDALEGLKEIPKVSFVMTTYNCADTVENAVFSLVTQSWPNVEIVICDDCSTDNTWTLLQELRKRSSKNIKIVRLGTNSGTYVAKNMAVANSTGDIIMFQDSDDYSHPDRALVQALPLLKDSELIGNRTRYSRFNPDTGKIIQVGDHLSKYGLITLAVRRRAFDEIGFFDAVRKAGDDEWFQRLRHLFGRQRIVDLDITLYLAELRENSLFADMLTFRSDGSIDQNISNERREYVEIFQARFSDRSKRRNWYKEKFPPVPKEPVDFYPKSITALEQKNAPVIGALCSIPSRENQLFNVVSRVLPQLDHLFVYLDKYVSVPNFLRGSQKITLFRSQDFDVDFRDNAKFLPYNDMKGKYGEFVYVTLDDDLEYPLDYVRTLRDRVARFDNRAVVGLHGVMYEEYPKAYFRRRFIYHFEHASMPEARLVNNLGTGTVAFHSDCFKMLDPRRWDRGGMVDIFISMEAKNNNVPMICIERHTGWLKSQKMPENDTNLFSEFGKKEEFILTHLQSTEPWGYCAVQKLIEAQPSAFANKLRMLLPHFFDVISVEKSFDRLRG